MIPRQERATPAPGIWSQFGRFAMLGLPAWLLYVPIVWTTTGQPFLAALRNATNGIAVAGVLSLLVWFLTGRFPWTPRPRMSWLLTHAGMAFVFGACWVVGVESLEALLRFESPLFAVWRAPFFGQRVLIGTWLYMGLVGAAYAVRSSERVWVAERRASEAEARMAVAQLTALRRKLNPHFLFNVLNSVTSLLKHDAEAAELALDRLATLLRSAVNDQGGLVTLGEEWAFVDNYIKLEQLRYGERLIVTTALQEETLDCGIPRFALQTVVENAVRHGIARKIDGGAIQIRSSLAGGQLRLRVTDNGCGDADILARMEEGTGLRTLRERLVAEFNGGAHFSIESSPGNGTTVTLTVPAVDPMP